MFKEQDEQQLELFIEQHLYPASGKTLSRRPETLKIEISNLKAVEENSLRGYFVELDDAIEARHIDDDKKKVKFGMSNMARGAKSWALRLKLND